MILFPEINPSLWGNGAVIAPQILPACQQLKACIQGKKLRAQWELVVDKSLQRIGKGTIQKGIRLQRRCLLQNPILIFRKRQFGSKYQIKSPGHSESEQKNRSRHFFRPAERASLMHGLFSFFRLHSHFSFHCP